MMTRRILAGLVAGAMLGVGQARAQGPDRSEAVDFLARGSAMQLWDISGDGAVTDWDVAMILFDRLAAIGPVDRDGDGHLTVEDQILTIEAVIYTSFGDLNTDGRTNLDDVAEAIARMQALDPLGDVNGDGSIDALDALLVMEMENPEIRRRLWAVRQMAEYMNDRVEEIRALGREAVMALWAGDPRLNDHIRAISQLYPREHGLWASVEYPDNHYYDVTRTWDRPQDPPPWRHTVILSKRENWPPNHWYDPSIEWKTIPGEHTRARSEQWRNLPGHRYDVSRTWPENHEARISRVWPPNHAASRSGRDVYPPEHLERVSETWNHGLEFSQRKYPPNHDRSLSQSWGPHTTMLSTTWPPNHLAEISSGWPPGVIPAWWPPNHFRGTSEEWSQPQYPLPPLFPPDHSVFTTLRDIIPQPPQPPR
jgi:hypothetical protein